MADTGYVWLTCFMGVERAEGPFAGFPRAAPLGGSAEGRALCWGAGTKPLLRGFLRG